MKQTQQKTVSEKGAKKQLSSIAPPVDGDIDDELYGDQNSAPETMSAAAAKPVPARRKTDSKPKNPKVKSSKVKKLTLVEMEKSLNSLETRLKRADTLTRKSVKSLESVVVSLDSRTQQEDQAQKSALSQHISRLSNKMEESMLSTREDIKRSLAAAINNPNQKALENTITAALNRLKETETQQAQAISKISRHLANLAKAVEARIVQDQITAAKALQDVETRLSTHIDSVEKEASNALSIISDKVTELNEAIIDKQKRTDKIVALKISELAEKTESNLDEKTQDLEDRLEKLEQAEIDEALTRPKELSQEMTASVSALAGQVEMLDSRLSAMDASFAALQAQTEIMGQDLMKAQGQLASYSEEASSPAIPAAIISPPPVTQTVQSAPPAPSSPAPVESAPIPSIAIPTAPEAPLSPVATSAPQSPVNIVDFSQQNMPQATPNPYSEPHTLTQVHTPEPVQTEQRNDQNTHLPVEFDPNTFTQSHTPHALQQAAATAFARPNVMPQTEAFPMEASPVKAAPYENVQPPQNNAPVAAPRIGGVDVGAITAPATPINYSDVESLPAGDPLLPYADPAYAEEHMSAVRIGDDRKNKKTSLFQRKEKKAKQPKKENADKTSLMTSRNMRVAALATGITLIGLFAAKAVLFGNDTPIFESNNSTEISNADFMQDNQGSTLLGTEANALPTIGEYADNMPQDLLSGSADTLEAAAANGNAIAQFQLGLARLEQAQTQEGVTLIREAAQTLPAAQYRLAKLYETGTGVDKNTEMAKDLTERAARSGNRIAMHDLAIYYAYGNGGVDVDMGTAAGWFEKAAERGVVDSQFNLAILFENGQGVRPSPADAYFWYSIAASQGDQTASSRLTALDGIMAPAEIDAAKTRAENFTPVAINQAANGIFKNLPWNKDNERRAEQRRAQVTQVQNLLNDLGFEVGVADGIMGRKTRQAINSFERVNGMTETGQITDSLIDKLSVAAGA